MGVVPLAKLKQVELGGGRPRVKLWYYKLQGATHITEKNKMCSVTSTRIARNAILDALRPTPLLWVAFTGRGAT